MIDFAVQQLLCVFVCARALSKIILTICYQFEQILHKYHKYHSYKKQFLIYKMFSIKYNQVRALVCLSYNNSKHIVWNRQNFNIQRYVSVDTSILSGNNNRNDNSIGTSSGEAVRNVMEKVKISDSEIKKSVFISQSYDVFTNLALEDWLYKNFDFNYHHVLLLWVNDPCVVIGRHQNPFTEANVSKLVNNGITLARRNSGGGAVYHDRGNLNCTFFTPRERYNRKYNLNVLTRALFREWAIKSEINKRDDVVINGKKISGTAAKLGHPNAYHHCTLLVDSNKLHLNDSLIQEDAKYISKATASVKSPIKNLVDINSSVNVPQLLSAVGYEYLRTSATELIDGDCVQIQKQKGFQLINPTERWFPGIDEVRDVFASWDWTIGKTPTFNVEKELFLKGDDKEHKILLHVQVEKGLMTDINIQLPTNELVPVVSALQNKPFSENNLNGIVSALKLVSTDNVKQAISGP